MRFLRRRSTAIFSAFLLFAGCDYWRNLVGDVTLSKSVIKIQMLDALTRERLADGVCIDRTRGDTETVVTQGLIEDSSAATGEYVFTCSSQWYYDHTVKIPVDRDNAKTDTIFMARKGGADWYPSVQADSLKVSLPHLDSMAVYPLRSDIMAYPVNVGRHFLYEWTFANNPQQNRTGDIPLDTTPSFAFDSRFPVNLGPDTLTLRVTVKLLDSTYEVGSYVKPLVWVRNQLPEFLPVPGIVLDHRFGCSGLPNQNVLSFHASGRDPDGNCDSIVYYSEGKGQSLGALHKTTTCDPQSISIPLDNPFSGSDLDSQVELDENLHVAVYDDSHQKSDTVFHLHMKSSPRPQVSLQAINNYGFQNASYIAGGKVPFRVAIVSHEANISFVQNWGDGDSSTFYFPFDSASGVDTVVHVYKTPGTYQYSLTATDQCQVPATAGSVRFQVRADNRPSVALDKRGYLIDPPGNYQLGVSIDDPDLTSQQDSLATFQILWGDGDVESPKFSRTARLDSLFTHHYSTVTAPTDSIHVTVRLRDANGMAGDTTFNLPKPP